MSDVDRLLENLRHVPVRLPKELEVRQLCRSLSDLLVGEANLLSLQSPQIVCGDIHGQFEDLLHLLELGGSVQQHRYLFLGDLVDRGKNSLETFLLLSALKVRHPDVFGGDVMEQFTRSNGISLICRAHQLARDGFRWHFGQKLVTIWSAPNYCYRCGNKAAILRINSVGDYDFEVFEAQALHSKPQPRKPKKRCRQFFL